MNKWTCSGAWFAVSMLISPLVFGSEANSASRDAIVEVTIVKAKYVRDIEPLYAGDVPMGSLFDVAVSKAKGDCRHGAAGADGAAIDGDALGVSQAREKDLGLS